MASVECQIIDISMRLSHRRTRMPNRNTSPYQISQGMNGLIRATSSPVVHDVVMDTTRRKGIVRKHEAAERMPRP
jgi:hypothetical protein